MKDKKVVELKTEQYAQAMEILTALLYGGLIKAVMPKVDVVLLERKGKK